MENQQLIYGIRAIENALETGTEFNKILLLKNSHQNPQLNTIVHSIKRKNISISYVPEEKFYKLTRNKNHQGIIGFISPIKYAELEQILESNHNQKTTYLLLDKLTDVRNVGAIIRTAECAGISAIIIPRTGSAPINDDTIKVSAGALFKIPICKVDHIKDAIFLLKSYGIKTVGASEKSSTNLYRTDLNESVALIMGNEEKGISKSVEKLLDLKVSIPMFGQISSLNVSVATSVIVYEIIRQQNFN